MILKSQPHIWLETQKLKNNNLKMDSMKKSYIYDKAN